MSWNTCKQKKYVCNTWGDGCKLLTIKNIKDIFKSWDIQGGLDVTILGIKQIKKRKAETEKKKKKKKNKPFNLDFSGTGGIFLRF